MLDKKYMAAVRKELLSYAEKRREVIKQAGDAQHMSKRAIFALQRDNVKEAEASLEQAGAILSGLAKKYQKEEGLLDEGSYRASLEEYAEAVLFNSFLKGKPLGKIPHVEVDADIFVGGLCDVPGEMLRYAIKSATERKFEMVEKCFAAAEEIIGELVDMDLTGYNRQKFDQAKGALNKLEQVRYEVSLRA
ncbi:MAG: hypothetical protein UX39_C0010G0013 [Candidatus Magasanikbacteria bacterium GW2011_GWA2_46_17]|uniref:Translin family protein n=1 Tax=Candidatus Magasanikbacteria bacterium GW2011_GWA2_46_17 TaxID=1619042 RepID=A0A0G1P0Q0_9BACT|nr:MAG: hypothetical protein UX39_C0010G0013 [Candidatus Magasanikbacteria bacterium GW2011_GWA2_46_17]